MKFRLVEDFEDNRKITLEVKFEVYGRYGDGGEIITAKVSGEDLRHALMRMVDRMRLYINSEDIEEKNLTVEQILDSISETNGDGCDMIYHLKNLTTGEVLINEPDCCQAQDWDNEDLTESLKEASEEQYVIVHNECEFYIHEKGKIKFTDDVSKATVTSNLEGLTKICDWLSDNYHNFSNGNNTFKIEKISNLKNECLTEAVKTPVIPEPYDKYFEIVESEPYYYAKECSYDVAKEIAQGAKVALRLPAHEVEMLEHDINNLRSNEWVDQFKQLSDRSKVKRLFFKYAVEPEGYVPGDKVSGATILAEVAPKDEYVEMFDSIYNLIDDPDFPVVEIVHDRLFPVDLPLDEGLFNLVPSISASVSIGEDVENIKGSGLKDSLKTIFGEIAKDDKNSWAKTAGIVVDNVSESDMENIVNVISDKFSNVAVSDSDKDKISKECPEKSNQIKAAETIGDIIDILDLRTLCKSNPDAVKSIVMVVLAVVAVIEPTPLVEIITGIVASLPSDVVAKILEIVLSLDLGHIVMDLIRKLLNNYINKEAAPVADNAEENVNESSDVSKMLSDKIAEIDKNARKYIFDRLTDFYMSDEPEDDRKQVAEKIFKKLKYLHREMFDFIPYWGGGENAADKMWDEGVDERITDLIEYENFPEDIINDVVTESGYIIPDND